MSFEACNLKRSQRARKKTSVIRGGDFSRLDVRARQPLRFCRRSAAQIRNEYERRLLASRRTSERSAEQPSERQI